MPLPGDGIFSATIPGQAANQLVAFYISATDRIQWPRIFPALLTDNSPRARMSGDVRRWQSRRQFWRVSSVDHPDQCDPLGEPRQFEQRRERLHLRQRQPRDLQHAGAFCRQPVPSKLHRSGQCLCNYKWEFNDDDQFLGATDFNKIHQPGNGAGDDASIQREQLANTFLRALGVPWLNRRYVAVYVNGNRRGTLMEDAQMSRRRRGERTLAE